MGKPLLTNAGTNAVAPGKHSTLILFFTHSLTSKNAGSLMPGVPASVSNATILPVSICDHTVIGAGAVVTKDITEAGVYAGNPARKIS